MSMLGMRLRQLREGCHMTLRQVAWKVGIHYTTLSKIENGHERPGEGLLVELALVYDTSSDELLALAGKLPPELSQRAAEDWDFAMLLRMLPQLPQHQLEEVYRVAGVV
jgi:transcriptional regulator with XRE-family HTH domain